jgi:hypothetical protein
MFQRKVLKEIEKQLASKEIIVLTGMRRVGKTTLLKLLFDKINSKNKVYLDLENLINQRIFNEVDFDNVWNNLKSFGLSNTSKAFVFLDEIQTFPRIVNVIKYLYDHYDIKFFLTGSSSYYLKNLFPESLAGRKIVFELFPLDFEEFLIFKEVPQKLLSNFEEKESARNVIAFEKLKLYYYEFLNFGGFPQVVLAANENQKKIYLNDIFISYFEKDVKTLADFKQVNTLRDLVFLLLQRVGSKLDITKLSSALNTSRPTLYSYLSFLEQTYFISLISPYSRNIDREISGTRKVYACDTGIINLFARLDEGNILENAVYNCLKQYGKVNYYQKRSGVEIDFILPELDVAIEVKTRADKQDIVKLDSMSKNLGFRNSFVISKDFVDINKVISVVDL